MMRAALFVAALAACGPTLSAHSGPPPGRIAAFSANDDHYDLDLSQGVAISIRCEHDGPCKDVVVSTSDESIVGVKGATFGAIDLPYAYGTVTPAGVVLVGRAPGKAKVKVKTAKGSKTIRVTVVPPPALGEHATVARP